MSEMTIRDQFAMAALAPLLVQSINPEASSAAIIEGVAKAAYFIADAMITAREDK